MHKQKYSARTEVRKGNRPLLYVFYIAIRLFVFFSGVKIKTENKCEKIESPSIVLCNHGSFYDFLYAQMLLFKVSPNYITARLYFYHKVLGTLLKKFGCFPKSMFATDLESTKNCLRVINEGRVLTMMPEARLSTAGRFEDIQESTFAFIKKSNVPVYTVKIQGDYLAKPKWAAKFRRGAVVEATLEQLFTVADIKKLSVDEIKSAVEQKLYYNEFQWLEERPKIKYRSREIAQGLENILNTCPVCLKKHTLKTKGKDIFCSCCGKLTSLDKRYGFDKGFRFENPLQWYDWQYALAKEEIILNENFALSSKVELRLPSKDGKSFTRHAGQGECVLDRQGLKFSGERDGEPYSVSFSLKRVYRLLFGAGENFEIYNGSEILYFVPKDKRTCVDWYITSRILYDETVSE